MANYRRRLFIVISAAIIWFAFLVWLIFQPHVLNLLGQERTSSVALACLMIVPILFFPMIAKRQPGSGVGLALIAGCIVLKTLDAVAFFALNIYDVWTDGARYMSDLLLLGATVFFIRQAVKKSREKQANADRTDY